MVGREEVSSDGGAVAGVDRREPEGVRNAGPVARLRRSVFAIPLEETRPERRGFHVASVERADRLAEVAGTFLTGYHAALLDPRPEALAAALEARVPRGWRGFAYEGAGMGLALQDTLFPRTPWGVSRLRRFLDGPGSPHHYLILVGAGWTFARIPRRYGRALAGLDPVLRWLAFDGYGFHEGFFRWRRSIEELRVPRRLRGYARRAFDQGLGRSLWFVLGMDPGRIAAAIEAFPDSRRGDLWSGVGLACAFAGGLPAGEVTELPRLAGPWAADAAQGAAFAAKARVESGDRTDWLETACTALCGTSAAGAKALTDETGVALPDDGGDLAAPVPAYEVWRRRTREALDRSGGTTPKETVA